MNPLQVRDYIIDNLHRCDPATLNRIRKTIEKLPLDDARSYMLHESTDDYIYFIEYKDGRKRAESIGRRAYERYTRDDDAIAIYRMDKDFWIYDHNLFMKQLDRKKKH